MKTFVALAVLASSCVGTVGGIGGADDPAAPGGSTTQRDDGTPGGPGTPGSMPGNGSAPAAANPIGMTATGPCTVANLARPRTWRLTHAQLQNTLADLGFTSPTAAMLPADSRVTGYANQADLLTVAPLLADRYYAIATELGQNVVTRASEFLGCPVTSVPGATCLGDFLKKFGLKMWRRPLTATETGKLTTLFSTAAMQAGGPEMGLRAVVQALFMSPSFLDRLEAGDTQQPGTVTRLTDYELASSLSYMLWDTAPDATLLDLAAQGKLHDQATLAAQATRMLASSKAARALHGFLLQWMRVEDLPSQTKDATVFPLYVPGVAADLVEESRLFLNSIMFDAGGDRSFNTLLTAGYGFTSARTAPIYGVPRPAGTGLVKTTFDPTQRRGLFTQGGFLAGHASAVATSVVGRGKYLREQVLCAQLPAPDPNAAKFSPQIANATNLTARERFAMHSVVPACAACHRMFDGLGFALESYDGIGKYRTTDKNKPIDPSGVLPLPSGPEITFSSFVELADKLAATSDINGCFAAQYLGYVTGKLLDQIDECEKATVMNSFVTGGAKLDALVLAVVRSPSFTSRKN